MAGRMSDINSRSDMTNVLKTLRAAAVYDLFGQVLLQRFCKEVIEGKVDPNGLIQKLPEGDLTFKQFADQIRDGLLETKRNANRALTRNLFRESFRLLLSYCHKASQQKILKSQKWYEFARVTANAISHNFRWEFRPYDLSCLPLSYNDVALTENLDGQPVSMRLEILIDLVDEMILFSKTHLPNDGGEADTL